MICTVVTKKGNFFLEGILPETLEIITDIYIASSCTYEVKSFKQ